ncbi:hypothetical protein WSM22_36750 [Cytophagales bacterium WSM2-2]|nr:hypothetical protein WSM22_36750 [Cytophagales bacterium WSM2-2]
MEYINKKDYGNISFWLVDEDIVLFKYAPKVAIDLYAAKQMVENRLNFTGGRSIYALIDFTNVKSVTKEARDYMNSPDGGLKGISGGAFLSNSVVATLFVNLYLKVSNPAVPAKFFTTQKDALDWLKKIRIEKKQYAHAL